MERQRRLTKPPGSLGRLETVAVRLAAIQRRDAPTSRARRVVLFAADHGVCAEGVSPYPKEVTAQMLENFEAGGAAINAIARTADAEVDVLDVGVGAGTKSFVRDEAMTEEELATALRAGVDAARRAASEGVALAGLGEMGIGNTTSASALTVALTGRQAGEVVGPGTGLDGPGLLRKAEVVGRGVELHGLDGADPLRALRCVGGLEIAGLVGFSLEAAARRLAILVDGFITTAALAVAWRLCPGVASYAIFSHLSPEPGHRALLDLMRARPLLDLELRLGEGTGAALAMPLVGAAVAAFNGMATFSSAGVSDRA